ncbi:hypothetical protein AB1Y20_002096 [Prymnesium parvum]|uniref:Sugar phosphate transporter domain-containing protein n=1 Tax=Prymnesium parvum TaxID=97485 RepID=A0AB34J856_PRYPA
MESLKQRWADLDVRCLSLLTPAAAFLAWEVVNVISAFQKRYLLSANGLNFNYICFISSWQQVFTLLCLSPFVFLRLTSASWDQFRRNAFGLSFLAILWVLTQLCLSAAEAFLGKALIELVKSCIPVPTLLISLVLERDRRGSPITYSAGLVASVVVTVIGACLAVYDDSQSSAIGYFLVIVATCMTACFFVAAGILLKTSAGGLNPINLTWYVACVSLPLLLISFSISSEPKTVFSSLSSKPEAYGWMTLSSLLYLLSSLTTFCLIILTSPLATAVSDCLKYVLMMLIAVGATHSPYVTVNFIGLGLLIPGVICYTYFMFLRRFETPRELPSLEAGMAVSMKGKSESKALLPDQAGQPSNVCCVVQ